MVDDRALPRHRSVAVDRVAAERGALVDQHHLDPDTLASQLLRLRLDRLDRRLEDQPSVAPALTSSGVDSRSMPIRPILIPW